MREIVARALVASLASTLVAFSGSVVVDAARAAEALTGDELRHYIPGAKIQIDTPLGSVIPVVYSADGSLEGRAGAVAFFLGSQKDTGKWWIEGSTLCQRWNTWFNGRVNCVRIYQSGDNRVEWIDQDGERGSGTVVALSNKVQTASAAADVPTKTDIESAPASKPSTATPAKAARTPHRASPARGAAAPTRVAAATTATVLPAPRPAPVASRAPVAPPPAPARRPASETSAPIGQANAAAFAAPVAPPRTGTASTRIPDAGRTSHGPTYRVINVSLDDVLNIRSGPSPISSITATIPPETGGIRQIGPCEGEWCQIRHGQSTGWVNRYFLTREGRFGSSRTASLRPSPITYRVARVSANDVLNLRRKPDPDSLVVATIPANGRRIRLTGYCIGEWCPVSHGRATGWAHRYFLALEF